jgi:hypothetical protein
MKKFIGVLTVFLVASGFVMAQAAVTNNNCTIEWVTVDGKASVRITNSNDKAQTVQYTIAGKEPSAVDVPAQTAVTIPYAGASANGAFAIAKVALAAKPKALPKGATSVAVAAAADAKPAATPAAATTTTPAADAKAPAPTTPAKKK